MAMAEKGNRHHFINPPSGFKKREEMTHADKLYNQRYNPAWHRELVDAITDHPPDRISSKEVDFVEHCDDWLVRGIPLTDPMVDWLEDIHGRD